MGDDKENLRKYNTEAFVVPEDEKMGNNRGMGDNAETGKSVNGNDTENGISISGNGPVGHGEGQEEASRVGVGYDSGSDEKRSETAENGLRNENENNYQNVFAKPLQKHQKRMNGIAVAVIVVTLAIAGVAGVLVWDALRQSTQEPVETDKPAVSEVVEGEEKPEEPMAEEISIEEPVVQRVYGNFGRIEEIFDGWWDFYIDEGVRNGEISREHMLLLAASSGLGNACVGNYEYTTGGKVENACVLGEEVRRKVAEMFGQNIELTEDDKIGSLCGGMIYDVQGDEFHRVGNGCGGGSSSSMGRVLEKAEVSADELYLYEKALLFDAQEYFHFGEDEIFGEKIGMYDFPYDESLGYEEYNKRLAEYKKSLTTEYGDEFKWTFRKNEEGNYIFAGLEKVQ